MKKLIPLLLLLLVFVAKAQNFEGTITWSMKMNLDPATQAKMDEAKQKMNDPATQAKMKEMQARMNDPQMKAMMDANPQMKAQMEAAMKMMQGGDISSMMPKGFVIKMKNQNVITKMEGGPMAMEMLYLKDKDATYNLNRENKTYSVMGGNRPASQGQGDKPKVTKTSETTKVLNYNCTKYLVTTTERNATITQTIWATTEIKGIDPKSLQKQRMGRGHQIMFDGIDGFPMRIEASSGEGNVTMEVTEIKRENLNDSDFTLPSDYKETQGMFGN